MATAWGLALALAPLGCSETPGKQFLGCQNDTQCEAGKICRTSDGQCVAKPEYTTVTIINTGDGNGTVTSAPAGIDCGLTCRGTFQVGSPLTLTATAAADSKFASFTVGCNSGTNRCSLTPTAADTPIVVYVYFALQSAPDPAVCNSFNFCWESPKPVGNRLNDAVLVAPGELWAVGDAGTVLHRKSSGAFELVSAAGLTRNLYGLIGTATDLYAVGEAGTILHRTSGNFVSMSSGVSTDLNDVWGSGSPTLTTVLAVGNKDPISQKGVILRGGTNWTADSSNTPDGINLLGIWGSGPSDVWAVGDQGIALHNGGGTSWTSSAPAALGGNPMRAISGASSTAVYASDIYGGIYVYNGNWLLSRHVIADDVYGLGVIGGVPYAVGQNAGNGFVLRFDGSNWQKDLATSSAFLGIAGLGASEQWAVGEAGNVWQFNGTGWQQRSLGQSPPLHGVFAADAQNVWAVGDKGTILRYRGSSFALVDVGRQTSLNAVWGSSASDVWIVGNGGLILHYDGSNLAIVQSGTDKDLLAVYGVSANLAWAVGTGGTFATWDGTRWNTLSTAGNPTLYTVWGTSAADVWAAGEIGSVFHTNNGSLSAVTGPATNGAIIQGMWGSAVDDFWVTADTKIFHYTNVFHRPSGDWSQAIIPAISGLRGIYGQSASKIYAVGSRGTLLRYDGSGLSWTLVPTGTNLDLAAPTISQNRLWLAGGNLRTGLILRSDQ